MLYKILIFACFSLVGSFITAFSFAATSTGKFRLHTLARPGVVHTASITGVIFGILLFPLMYWSLKDKNLIFIIPPMYCLAFIATVLLCYISSRVGYIGSIVFWISILVVLKYSVPAVSVN